MFGILVFFFFLLVQPTDALAWGPGVHMAIGNYVLAHLDLLPTAVAALLAAHPREYLYGCLSADIFIGKGCRAKTVHSHNWATGHALLREAKNEAGESYAHGYLSHLAADVIAHNYLVPNMLGFSAGRGKFAHTYAEMLADAQVEWPAKQASQLFHTPYPDADQSLLAAMGQKKLPFAMKKRLFQQSLHMVERRSYRMSLRVVRRLRPFARKETLIRDSIELAKQLVLDVLHDPRHSSVLHCDPIGSMTLHQVRSFRRKQRSYYFAHDQGIIFPLDARLENVCLGRPS